MPHAAWGAWCFSAALCRREARSLCSSSLAFCMRLQSFIVCPALPQKQHLRMCGLLPGRSCGSLRGRPATIYRGGASPLSSLRRTAARAAADSISIGHTSGVPSPTSSPLSARAVAVAFLRSCIRRNCTIVSSPTTSPFMSIPAVHVVRAWRSPGFSPAINH